ncbi:hypothetical protein SSP531S_29400 [Streptomyces spongiicola]|uniref:Uncharacterized protein n=1 Tax=Streptomyces spongiicola TaxID=1690221 RepID=A0A388SYU1_9ACTN|nr:hypothetical protein SSP531S_29400 [Streptomyces spongiicola]
MAAPVRFRGLPGGFVDGSWSGCCLGWRLRRWDRGPARQSGRGHGKPHAPGFTPRTCTRLMPPSGTRARAAVDAVRTASVADYGPETAQGSCKVADLRLSQKPKSWVHHGPPWAKETPTPSVR